MDLNILLPSPVEDIAGPFIIDERNADKTSLSSKISVIVKRDDLIHPIISGNKWRKLSAALTTISQQQYQHVASFGGAYSNHLHALGYACAALNINFTAVVRGDYSKRLTPTLQDLQRWGTHLHFVSKIEYKNKTSAQYCQLLRQQLNADYLIPEGGSHAKSIVGVGAIMTELETQAPDITHIILPVASAGTLAGLVLNETLPHVKIIGVGVLKGEGYLEDLVNGLLASSTPSCQRKEWEILHDYHHGGYAKTSASLRQYVSEFNQFYADQNRLRPLAIEPIYSGKCFYALNALLSAGYFPSNSKVLILHTGGLQGARSLPANKNISTQ